MGKVVWTRTAQEDLEEIGDYIANDSLSYARKVVKELIARVKILKTHPLIGRVIPERPDHPNQRELIEGNYRIMYKIEEAEVFILRVLHSFRRFPDSI